MKQYLPPFHTNSDIDELLLRPWEGRAIIHLDMDAFFAAVAELDDPSLRGKAVIVGGSPDGRGVVCTANYEARKFGVHSAMPAARAAKLCPHAVWLRTDFDRYKEMSAKVIAIIESHTPIIERTSIDEAYADISPSPKMDPLGPRHPIAICKDILERVAKLGLTASIGLASSKTVAKIASDLRKPHGLSIVSPGTEALLLSSMPISKLPGIGPKSEERLTNLNIRSLGDLALSSPQDLRHILGSNTQSNIARAAGIDTDPVEPDRETKSVSNEETFGEDLIDKTQILSELRLLAEKTGWRLRSKGLKGRTIKVKVRFSDLSIRTLSKTIDNPTDDEHLFYPIAEELLLNSGFFGRSMRLIGIGISNFSEREMQLALLEDMGECLDGAQDLKTFEKRTRLNQNIDKIRDRFGYDAIGSGLHLKD